MAKALDNLVAARQLKAEPSSPDEINTLPKRAAGLLADAANYRELQNRVMQETSVLFTLTLGPSPGRRGMKKPFSLRDKGTLEAEQKGWDEGRAVMQIGNAQ